MSGEAFIGVLVAIGAITIVLLNPHLREGNIANAQNVETLPEATEFKKPDDGVPVPLPKTPRQKICAELIKNIEKAYVWDVANGNTATRPYLAATIQIYNGVGGPRFCYKYVINILEDM